jgi:hypothetical protein
MEPEMTALLEALAWRSVTAALVLLIFASWYDQRITALEARGRQEGYMALIVAGGTLVVLVAGLFVAWPLGPAAWAACGIVTLMFLPAGIPMLIGSARRHNDRREEELRRIRAAALRQDEPA